MGNCKSSQSEISSNIDSMPSIQDTIKLPVKKASLNIATQFSFKYHYKVGHLLGEGSFSIVRKVTRRKDGAIFAAKFMRKSRLTDHDCVGLEEEVNVLKKLAHPNIVHYISFFEEDDYYILVTELIKGGELFDRIVQREFYDENSACTLLRALFDALNFMHKNNISHRDLKPENILVEDAPCGKEIVKLADFGFAKEGKDLKTQCGTPTYVAPEILQGLVYSQACDVWSMGIIMYILLCGYPPFMAENQSALYKQIIRCDLEFESPYWDDVSDTVQNLIRSILVVDPELRPSCEDVLNHQWFNKDNRIDSKPLKQFTEQLGKYNKARQRWKRSIHAVIISNGFKRRSTSTEEKQFMEKSAGANPEAFAEERKKVDFTASSIA